MSIKRCQGFGYNDRSIYYIILYNSTYLQGISLLCVNYILSIFTVKNDFGILLRKLMTTSPYTILDAAKPSELFT